MLVSVRVCTRSLQVNSARPNGVSNIHNKTPCIGTGLRDVFAADFNMRLGPVWCVDDMPQVYSEQCEFAGGRLEGRVLLAQATECYIAWHSAWSSA